MAVLTCRCTASAPCRSHQLQGLGLPTHPDDITCAVQQRAPAVACTHAARWGQLLQAASRRLAAHSLVQQCTWVDGRICLDHVLDGPAGVA